VPTVLITGANRGIGLEFARSFAADGWRVIACCRHPEKSQELKEIGGEIEVHKLDVTDGLAVASLARELADVAIDILINNAGTYGPETGFGETDYDDWLDVLKVNTLAPMRLAERFVKQVGKSDRKLIVNISSRSGSIADNTSGGSYIYRTSKAALNMVTKGLAVDLKRHGITVVSFHPGWVQTDMGGDGAPVSVKDSVAGMRAAIDKLTPADSVAPLDDPLLADFVDNLDRINALAEQSPGFVWRLQTEAGNATDVAVTDDPQVIVNLTVWNSVERLFEFVYKTGHSGIMARRREWFGRWDGPHMALWWVPSGHRPSVEDALERLALLKAEGPTAAAFTFKTRFPAPHAVPAEAE
jgi:NAD(P)-dependent dehydrogenase (short-subunit alcohol dehydrogenase family)